MPSWVNEMEHHDTILKSCRKLIPGILTIFFSQPTALEKQLSCNYNIAVCRARPNAKRLPHCPHYNMTILQTVFKLSESIFETF